jgi:alkanesulfonate monooxygenase SsuD/methylene tetrahydromethanopterin reductase-like flavin-dependent oxidoreductase (luciferase family)
MAGRVADGIILQYADPELIEWCLGFVKEGARAAGRDPKDIEVMSAAPVWVSDDLSCGSRTRALVPCSGFEPCHGSDPAIQAGRFASRADLVTCRTAATTIISTTAW